MKLWLVRDKKDRILGPYAEQEICDFIKEGRFEGEEEVSSYPSGKWKPLSSHPPFYDTILNILNKKNQPEEFEEEGKEESLEPTVVIPKQKEEPKKKRNIKLKFSAQEEERDEEDEESQIIEMENLEEAYLDRIKKTLSIPLLIIGGLVLMMVFLFFPTNGGKKKYVQILAPNIKKTQPLKKRALKKQDVLKEDLYLKIQKNFSYYLKDEVQYHLKTQDRLIQILEEHPNTPSGYYHLCLVHLELWPFAHQDFKDKKVLSKVFSQVNLLDKGGIYSGLCSATIAMIKNQHEKALLYIDSSIKVLSETGESPAFFHYLKAVALKNLKRFSESVSYAQSSYRLIPQWIKPYMLEAQILYETKHYSSAANIYRKITKMSSSHIASQLLLGVIEYKYFKNYAQSEKRLKFALANLPDFMDAGILTEAYSTLAFILLKQKDRSGAEKNIKKAYALDPTNKQLLKVIKELGLDNKMSKTQVDTRQIIYKGDAFRNGGDCVQAQALYKKAYKLDRNKNSLAATQMARCYWKMGISGEAIRWLKKAIDADPQRMEAYFLLSDYLSKNYSFGAAKEILNIARQKQKNSYEVFKGFSLLALRQKNYKLAITYAQRSLKLYASDVGVYNILSEASRFMKDRNNAYEYAVRAIEEDVNDTQSQINFAIALGLAYGFSRGEERFKKLIQIYPLIIEYRQALGEYYFDDDKYDLALSIFSQLVEQNPQFKMAYMYLGRIYSFEGERDQDPEKFNKSIYNLRKASLIDPSDPNPLFYMGQTFMKAKRFGEAENFFEKTLRINGNYPLIHYYIGKVNFLQGGEDNLNRALKFARTESEKNPNLSFSYILLGDVYKQKAEALGKTSPERRANYELCAKEYQKALKIRANDISLYVGLMDCYRNSGDLDSALQIADKLFDSPGMSGYPELYRQVGLIYEMKGNIDKARNAYNQYFSLYPRAPDKAKIQNRLKNKR